MIKPSKICFGYDLFIHSIMVVNLDFEIEPLIPFCGPIYIATIWIQLVSYMFSISIYGLYANAFNNPCLQHSKLLYIDGRLKIRKYSLIHK